MLGLGGSPVPTVHPVAVECCLVAWDQQSLAFLEAVGLEIGMVR